MKIINTPAIEISHNVGKFENLYEWAFNYGYNMNVTFYYNIEKIFTR